MRWVIENDGKTYILERPKDGLRLELEWVSGQRWKARLLVGRPWGWPANGDVGCVLHKDLPNMDREEAGREAVGLIAIWMTALSNDLADIPFGEYHP